MMLGQMILVTPISITSWLESGGAYTTHKDPVRRLKLLLDHETSIGYDKLLESKICQNENA